MLYRILADFVVLIHFGWIVFVLIGFFITVLALIAVYIFGRRNKWERRFLDRWVLRTVHIGGIAYVAVLAIMHKYCPLTTLENFLRHRHDPATTYPGGFLIYYIERLVYPDLPIRTILIPTITVAVLTLLMFTIRPPQKIKWYINRLLSR